MLLFDLKKNTCFVIVNHLSRDDRSHKITKSNDAKFIFILIAQPPFKKHSNSSQSSTSKHPGTRK